MPVIYYIMIITYLPSLSECALYNPNDYGI